MAGALPPKWCGSAPAATAAMMKYDSAPGASEPSLWSAVPNWVSRYAIACVDAAPPTFAACKPMTAYAVLVGSGEPNDFTKPPLAVI